MTARGLLVLILIVLLGIFLFGIAVGITAGLAGVRLG